MYEVNGEPILLMPESGGWEDRKAIGNDGLNRPVYEPTYSYELRWSPMTPEQFCQLCGWYEEISVTGTSTMVLPAHCGCTYTGTLYSDVLFEEPHMDVFWEGYIRGVTMRVINIRK